MKYTEDTLAGRLDTLGNSGGDPYHMPGHKRNPGILPDSTDREMPGGSPTGNALRAAFRIDVTEIPGFDDLHEPSDILKREMDRAAAFYGTRSTVFSVNGSTASNLAAVFAAVPEGGTVLAADNVHRSITHAISLRHLRRIRMPLLRGFTAFRGGGPADPEGIETAFALHPEIDLVIVTSPTYDGILSDIRSVAEIAHAHGALLLVDEAHGAHLPMHALFPSSAIEEGADLVVHSLHKTLPALTQTSLLHNVTGRVSEEAIREAMDIFETSSPSYVLMASIAECLRFLYREKDGTTFGEYLRRLMELRRDLSGLSRLSLIRPDALFDPGRLLIGTGTTGLSGEALSRILRERCGIECEYAEEGYVLLITSVADTDEMYDRLRTALRGIDGEA